MLQSVLSWIKVFLIDLLLNLIHLFLDHFIDLFLSELLSIQANHVLGLLLDLFACLLDHLLLLRYGKFRALLCELGCDHLLLM